MIGKRGVAVAAVLIGAVVFGCGGKQRSTMDPTVRQGGGMPRAQTAENRAERLGQAVDDFAAARKGLQGHSDDESRRQLAEAMAKLSDVITLLNGPQQDGAFRQQLRIVDRARTQLTSDATTAPEPTINSAIRAAETALSDVASEQFADNEQVKAAVEALRPRVRVLTTVRGPIHGFETARALDALGAAAERMADVYQQRMQQAQPATAPAPAANPQ